MLQYTREGMDTPTDGNNIAQPLLIWYSRTRRDLPWRHTKDPYRIWVSEIMLQQTRVETVKDYYKRFLERLPDVHALAEAPEQVVLKLWEGLGYYSRARNMQRAARIVVEKYGGEFPADLESLRSLPGIGAYTAGAVASIAFGLPAPAVDGNVKRVGARIFGIREPIDGKAAYETLSNKLTTILNTCDAGQFNQALMELGATLCAPRAPKCDQCPFVDFCDASREGDAESLPVLAPKQPPKAVCINVCILTHKGMALLMRRRERLLKGLYVFCLLEGEEEPRALQALLTEMGLPCAYGEAIGEATHIFTHRVWQMKLWHFAMLTEPDGEWLDINDALMADARAVQDLPLPTAMKAARKAALALLDGQQG
jgi:A/G-specific adenine glycosylase